MEIKAAHFFLNKVTYDEDIKGKEILSLLETSWDCLKKANDSFPVPATPRAARPTAILITMLATRCYKQEAFDFEKEWRAIPHISSNSLIQFDTRPGTIRPYIPMHFDLSCIEGIIIGAAVADPMIENTISLFLANHGIHNVSVRRSCVKLVPPL